MNIIKKYWESVYLFILPLLPGTCILAGVFWTIFKFLGYYPELSWGYFLAFDFSQIIYMAIALFIIHKNKRDGLFITRHLTQIKGYILIILLIQYQFILNLFPSSHMWECTILFLLVSMFFFDTKMQMINSIACIFLLVLSYVRYPEKFLPENNPYFIETISFQIVVLVTSTLLLILISYLVERFLIQEQENREENANLLRHQLDYYQQMDLMDQELRKFRHDIKNHFFCMEELLRQGKEKELTHYFEDLQDSFVSEHLYFSGNSVTDAILNHELHHHCRDTVQISVSGTLTELETISSMDLCTIFSNMLTNAIAAVNQCEKKPAPRLEIQFQKGTRFFSITIRNQSSKSLPETISSKSRDHGHGLQKIRRVTEKYHGFFEQTQKNDLVTTTVYLPL